AYREHPIFPVRDLLNTLSTRDLAGSILLNPFAALRHLAVYGNARSFKLVCLLGIAVWLPWFAVERRVRLYALWAVAVTALVFVIPLRIDGFSVWLSVFRRLPGFSVIRDPTRIIFLYELAVALAIGFFLKRLRLTPVL